MSSSAAELSSLATALEELTKRVVSIADAYAAARREDLATELYGVERQLTNSLRRLDKVTKAEGAPR
jgi:hypothetical protein